MLSFKFSETEIPRGIKIKRDRNSIKLQGTYEKKNKVWFGTHCQKWFSF